MHTVVRPNRNIVLFHQNTGGNGDFFQFVIQQHNMIAIPVHQSSDMQWDLIAYG